MGKKELSEEQRKLDMDLWIIAVVSLVVLGIFIAFQKPIVTAMKNENINILFRVALGGAFQFGLAGLGITLVSVYRKESLLLHGLCVKNIQWALLLSVLCVLPHFTFSLVTKGHLSYLPFQTVLTTKEVLISGFPSNILGMGITSVCWGFLRVLIIL